MNWKCDECGAVNSTASHNGFLVCPHCHQKYLVEKDAPVPKKTAEEWLSTISTQLAVIEKSLKDSEAFRTQEKKVLGEIEAIMRRYK